MRYVIHHEDKERRQNACDEIMGLDPSKKWVVEIKPYTKKRSLPQNSFLHGVTLRILSDETGNDIDDLKDYLMGEAFGWETYQVVDQLRKRPIKGTSALTTTEFKWFLEWIEAWAAKNLDILLPKPNEYIE